MGAKTWSKVPKTGDRVIGDVNGMYHNSRYQAGDYLYKVVEGNSSITVVIDPVGVKIMWGTGYLQWLEEEQFWTFIPHIW